MISGRVETFRSFQRFQGLNSSTKGMPMMALSFGPSLGDCYMPCQIQKDRMHIMYSDHGGI